MQKSQPQIAVAFPLLKNKHDGMIVEKLTELGVKDFFPIITERTVRKLSANTVEKFHKVAIAAMKQCDNAFLPEIAPPEMQDKVSAKGFALGYLGSVFLLSPLSF